jgi:hypothetical protein
VRKAHRRRDPRLAGGEIEHIIGDMKPVHHVDRII